MEADIRVGFTKASLMEMAELFTQMVQYMMVSGLRGILMVKAHLPSPMAHSMKVIGAKECITGEAPT